MTRNEEILLKRGEYAEVDEGVKALVRTVVEKLPNPTRKKYQPLIWREQALKKQAELIQDGVHDGFLSEWMGLDARRRTDRVQYKILTELQQLRVQYGPEAINAGLAKVCGMGDAQKATVPYLKAILKNGKSWPTPESSARQSDAVIQAARPTRIGREHWERIMSLLASKINSRSYATWLHPCVLIEISSTSLTIGAPSEVHVNWLKEHYVSVISQAFAKIVGHIPIHLQIIVAERGEEPNHGGKT